MQKGNLLKQGEVPTLLQTSEVIEVRLNTPQESERALAIIQQHQEHASTWLHGVKLENKRDMQPVLLIEAPITHSSEVNALLAHNDIFAAEIRPREGNLEDVFLEVTTGGAGNHTGMEALAEHLVHADVIIHESNQVLEGEEKHG
jgi:hypothetical protein